MDDNTREDAYYRDIQWRLRRLVIALADRLPPGDRRLVDELIDANECGVALEMLSDALAEDAVRLDEAAVAEIADLAETMGLPKELATRLRPLSVG